MIVRRDTALPLPLIDGSEKSKTQHPNTKSHRKEHPPLYILSRRLPVLGEKDKGPKAGHHSGIRPSRRLRWPRIKVPKWLWVSGRSLLA